MPKHTRKPYFLLDQPVAVDDANDMVNRLLGLAVLDPYNPTSGYSPNKLRARDAIDDLYPTTPVVCKDFQLVRSRASEGNVYAKLQDLVKISLKLGDKQIEDIGAAVFRRFSMDNTLQRLEDLFGDSVMDTPGLEATQDEAAREQQSKIRKAYGDEVLNFLQRQKKEKIYVITGFITCSDLKKNVERSRNLSTDVAASTGPAGLSSPVKAEVGAGYSQTRGFGVHGAYDGEYLIACSYFPLYAKEGSWYGRLTSSIFGKGKNYSMGEGELWRLGDRPEEGNSEALLGGESDDTESAIEDDQEGMEIEFLYPDSDDDSDDEFA